MNEIEVFEEILGPRDSFIPSRKYEETLRNWAIAKSIPNANLLTLVELTNLYHEQGGKPRQTDTHEWLVKVLEALNAPGFEVSLTRKIARAEMREEILSGETTRKLIEETLNKLAPRRLEIISPFGQFMLNGLYHYKTETVIKVAALNHNIMLVGPAGCGKTSIAEITAKALNLPFYITSTINDAHELTGFIDGYGLYHPTPFRHAFENGGLWVADEIDAWDAAAFLAANSALSNGYAAFPDREGVIYRHPNFRIIATANTFGNGADRVYVGRNELDAASLDRFVFIEVDYDLNLERMFASGNIQWLERVHEIRKKVRENNIRHVVSSRPIIKGVEALAAGIDWQEVEEMYIWKGLSKANREKVDKK